MKETEANSRQSRRQNRKMIAILSAVVVVPLLLFVVLPYSILGYDERNRISISCSVVSAEPGSSSNRSLRGIGSSGPQVEVDTDSCGPLLLRDGISGGNAGTIAAELEGSDTVDFLVGSASYEMRNVLSSVGITPEAYAYDLR
jgi:hypothetical protein